jgi:hypothetical protein
MAQPQWRAPQRGKLLKTERKYLVVSFFPENHGVSSKGSFFDSINIRGYSAPL